MKQMLFTIIAAISFNATAKAQTAKACVRCQAIDAVIAKDDIDSSSRLLQAPLSADPELQGQEADAVTRAAVKWAMGDQITQELYVNLYRGNPKAMTAALVKLPEQTQRLLTKLIKDYSRNPKGNH